MPLTKSRDFGGGGSQLTEEEQKKRDKARRKWQMILDEAADEEEAVLITVLKDLGKKPFNDGDPVQGYLIRLIVLTGEYEGHVEDELPIYKKGFTNRIGRAFDQHGIGVSMVSRLGRYGTRSPRAIGLEDNQDGDEELAEKALAKFGDPFDGGEPTNPDGPASAKKSSLTEGTEETKAKAKAKAKAEADMEDPPF